MHIFHFIVEKYLKSLMRKSFVFAEYIDLFNDLKFPSRYLHVQS